MSCPIAKYPHAATLKIIQGFTTRSLSVFERYSIFYSGPLCLHLQVLDFIAQRCSDRVRSVTQFLSIVLDYH
jgi:hypothetical protein